MVEAGKYRFRPAITILNGWPNRPEPTEELVRCLACGARRTSAPRAQPLVDELIEQFRGRSLDIGRDAFYGADVQERTRPEFTVDGCAVADAGARFDDRQTGIERIALQLLNRSRFQHGDIKIDAWPVAGILLSVGRRHDRECP